MASPQRSTAQETPEQPGSPAEGGARPVVRIVEEAAGEAAQAIISSDEVGAEIVDEAGEPHVTFAQLRAYGNSLVARLALLVIVLVLLAGVYARAFTVLVELPSTAGEQSIPGTMVLTIGAAAITLACALPVLLMYCMKVLVVGSLNARARYRMPLRRAGGDAEEARLFDEASRIWAHEVRQFDQRSSRLSQHVNFYGFFGSAALSATVMLGLRHLVGQGGGAEARGAVALALLAASVGAFVSEVSRMIVRAANRDASARMFAWASKRFLLILLTTAVLCGLVVIGKPSAALPGGTASWLLLGAGVAFLGDRASQAVGERVAGVLGVGQIKHPEPSDLAGLDGMTEEDVGRLTEEGVASVHALAFSTTPRLYLSTPFTLHRICDWQDQALLVARLGPARAALFRDQLLVRGATEARRLARDFLGNKLSASEKADLLKVLGVSTPVQGEVLMGRLAQDPVAGRLEMFRRAAPGIDADEERGLSK